MEERKGAVVFLLDRAYLYPLKVLLHTLLPNFPNRRFDLLVLTDDPQVFADRFLAGMADKVLLIDETRKTALRRVNQSKVARQYKPHNKLAYWFLKFFCFDDWGYDFHIFLDADMVCLNPDFRLDSLICHEAFSAAPTVGYGAIGFKGARPDEAATGDDLARVEAAVARLVTRTYPIQRPINSGVMVVGKALLGPATVAGLIDIASRGEHRLEQDIVREHVEASGASFRSMPVHNNLPVLPLYALGPEKGRRLLEAANILHFNKHKPWTRVEGSGDWVSDLWWAAEREARAWIGGGSG